MAVPLIDSPSLFPVPAIDDLSNAVVLNPSCYANWEEMFTANDAKLDYLLEPGDYQKWGPLMFDDKPGNTKDRPKTVRYYNPGVDDTLHPAQRSNSAQAQVASLRFDGPLTRNWLVQGLKVSRSAVNPAIAIAQGASNITVDFCLIEYARINSFRIRYATYCTIQRCVIRESINKNENQGPGESMGIFIGNIDKDVVGIKILDNEIYNVGDGIQIGFSKETPMRPVEVIIEGNDIYLEPSRYINNTNTTWDENGIDIKAGSNTPYSTVIRNNRMWGFRRNAIPSALGEIIVVQLYCRNVVVEDNIMGDAPRGMKDENWLPGEGNDNRPRDVVFRRNQFYDIRDYSNLDAGAITKPITADISFVDNHFARSAYLADQTPPNYRGAGPDYTGNVLVEVDAIQRPCGEPSLMLKPSHGNTVATAPHGFETYERRRWTGPEDAIGAVPSS